MHDYHQDSKLMFFVWPLFTLAPCNNGYNWVSCCAICMKNKCRIPLCILIKTCLIDQGKERQRNEIEGE